MSGADRPWEAESEPERWAGYFDPQTGLMRNLSDPPVQTQAQLQEFEDAHVAYRLVGLREEPVAGVFDLAHVQEIHRRLFVDVYPWAGELRTVGVSKGQRTLPDGSTAKAGFLPVEHIPYVVNGMAAQLREENYLRGLTNEQFADRLAVHFNDLNEAHPARDGNGRVQRALWDQLAEQAGHVIHWRDLSAELNIHVSHEARAGDLEPLRSALRSIVTDAGEEARLLKATEAARLSRMDTPTMPSATLSVPLSGDAHAGYRAGRDAGPSYGLGR